jgi:hypothetical protein
MGSSFHFISLEIIFGENFIEIYGKYLFTGTIHSQIAAIFNY